MAALSLDITNSLQAGNNDVQINVFATSAGRGGLGVRRLAPHRARLPRRAAAEAGRQGGRAPQVPRHAGRRRSAGMGGGRGTPTPPARACSDQSVW